MSMIGNFVAITNEQLQTLVADPDAVGAFLYPENGDDPPGEQLDIDKAWHGIHFLLTGDAWDGAAPWSLVVLGGTPIGEDVGYGPARYLLPAQVREVADALGTLPRNELAARFSPQAMEEAEIYPEIWVRDGDDGLEYLLANYDVLVKFYQQAAEQNCAMLLYIN